MDLQYLKELLAIFDTSSATDLMIEEDGCSVSLSRRPAEPTNVYGSFPQQVPIQTPYIQAPIASAPVEEAVAAVSANTHSILSPIVGTFIMHRIQIHLNMFLLVTTFLWAKNSALWKR